MSIKQKMIAQFSKPTGLTGHFIGWLMAFSNKPLVRWTIEKADIQQTDKVLEIGYGPGVACEKILNKLSSGSLVGIDHSPTMHRMARKRNKVHCKSRKAVLRCGVIDDLKYPSGYFDVIFGSNVHFFWSCPSKEFSKLRSLLKQEGKLLMIFQPKWASSMAEVEEIAEKCKRQFRLGGFSTISIEFYPMKPVAAIAITGWKAPVVYKPVHEY